MAGDAVSDPRSDALAALGVMGSPPEERFDRITRMARDLFGVPMAEIHFLDESTLFTKSPQNPGWPLEYPREGTFCDATLQKRSMLVIPDLGADPAWADNANVAGAPYVRFYAGRPISVDGGLQLGTICLLDFVPRDLSEDQQRLLDEFGSWVERELRDSAERDRAAEVQAQLLPLDLTHPDGYALTGMSVPRLQVAGDFYDWWVGDGFVDITLADVMGKGAAAAIIAASIRSAFHARVGDAPTRAVAGVNRQLLRDFTATGTFATLFHCRLETETGRLDFVDAGHGLSVVLRADGSFQRLASLGLPLGIAEDGGWMTQSVELAPGDALVSFTDGVLDLYDGTLNSLAEVTALARASASAEEFFASVRTLSLGEKASDDVTVLVVSRT
ncbi:PP2C family protein-serine/threonine phosphatase [Rathayibacter sp. VKM Ac-2754]|uniref:PP2C family protein-serine/threonine phosphatase n=1 Tax=Rathayibacter sp. VKM Ac-2754 TaxID=2609251 RepID=UPI00135A895D|nr:SpoIIE family protein phosphatase [Rathayibacter sp. VKM Ac-2754]MWV60392.1 SpoIIE family protein phosphatase [Rathayibacter sp. VKM Ac-2754]